jgi:hypothetical protein
MTDQPPIATAPFYAGDAIGLVAANDPVPMEPGPELDSLLECGLLRPAPPEGDDPPADPPADPASTPKRRRTSAANTTQED